MCAFSFLKHLLLVSPLLNRPWPLQLQRFSSAPGEETPPQPGAGAEGEHPRLCTGWGAQRVVGCGRTILHLLAKACRGFGSEKFSGFLPVAFDIWHVSGPAVLFERATARAD